ncbi:MAG: ABC transporter ATP-binding protein [Alphaproteobacteria bacterium]|nr:ABC transporter ATP-binding protein [Alphaproteobacteria bacterium]
MPCRRQDQADYLSRSSCLSVLKVTGLTTELPAEGRWLGVLKDVSFNIGARETLALVGESGSGKSMMALSIMRLLPPLARISGRIRLAGRDLLDLPETEMERLRGRDMAMIFQEPMSSLNPVVTIGVQIGETLRRHHGLSSRAAQAEALRLLERVRIPAARSRLGEYPHQLSGGMLQRIMIAIALAGKPKLLIADEPTTALDVTIQAQILRLIRELQDQDGMAVLFITHDMGVVAEIADRMVVMRHAHLVETGDATHVFAQPREPYTRALLAAVPQLGSMQGQHKPAPFPLVDTDTGETILSGFPDAGLEMSGRKILEVKSLVTRFDQRGGLLRRVVARVHAVEDVSFDLRAGETLALVGESGCGKSTIGRSILRMVTPKSGSIMVDGTDVLTLSGEPLRRYRQKMQMIFQDPISSLNPRLRVEDILTEPLRAHGMAGADAARDIARDLLHRVGLDAHMLDRFPHQFSGGQKQRLCIARVLALNPALIIADEAVSALDVSIKAQIVNLMLELQASLGIAFLFISHDMSVVERIAHRVAVMRLGEIVEIGPREAVFGQPSHSYTQRLLAAVPAADPARRSRSWITDDSELPSPIRSPDFIPPIRHYTEVMSGHYVMAE